MFAQRRFLLKHAFHNGRSYLKSMNFWIGTSGFQYAEWKGNFYPEDLPAAKMLPFYARRFSTTEINYTFHRIPAPENN
jgi:uncharacterized protein YecE (DUF72 family)